MGDENKQYCLKWNNFSDNILTSLESLRGDEEFVDVTIACEGHSLKAHKVVLSACSLYIKKLLKENPCAHPIIILKDVALPELRALLSFMYNGQVMVAEDQIPRLLRTAELLEIRGLADLTGLKEDPDGSPATRHGNAAILEKMDSDSDQGHHVRSQDNHGQGQQSGDGGWNQGAGQTGDSEVDDEYESDEEDEEEEATLPDFAMTADMSTHAKRELQVTTVLDQVHFAAPPPVRAPHTKDELLKPCGNPNLPHHPVIGEMHHQEMSTRAMLTTPGQRAADIAARVSQMEDSLLPGDVLVIGETHITPARCVPRPLKPPPPMEPPPSKQPCFDAQGNDGRLSLEMSLRLQVQRKLEAERLRAMERLRHAEAAAFNDSVMSAAMECPPFPAVLTNGVHHQENGGPNHRDDHVMQPLVAQQPQGPPAPTQPGGPASAPPSAPTIPLPLSPDLQLKMLMCRDFKKYTNMLLVAVFGREVLATHCLNGSKGSAKPRLDTEKVTRVIATVMEKFDVPASTVREAIRVKLNNEDKLKKRSKRTAANPLL